MYFLYYAYWDMDLFILTIFDNITSLDAVYKRVPHFRLIMWLFVC